MHFRNFNYSKLWLVLSFVSLPSCSNKYSKSLVLRLEDGKPFFLKEHDVDRVIIKLPERGKDSNLKRWYYLAPLAKDYDNTQGCQGRPPCQHHIQYSKREIKVFRDKNEAGLSQLSNLLGLGTHNFVVATDDKETRFQVVVRRDNTYPGILTELLGVPFVYAPSNFDKGGHQTDQRLGADCVALVIYGKRRLGFKVPYVAPKRLNDVTYKIGDNFALDSSKIRAGDVLHFGFQTAVISQDLAPVGKLGVNDMVIHTYHKYAEEVPFSTLPYKGSNFDILRWR